MSYALVFNEYKISYKGVYVGLLEKLKPHSDISLKHENHDNNEDDIVVISDMNDNSDENSSAVSEAPQFSETTDESNIANEISINQHSAITEQLENLIEDEVLNNIIKEIFSNPKIYATLNARVAENIINKLMLCIDDSATIGNCEDLSQEEVERFTIQSEGFINKIQTMMSSELDRFTELQLRGVGEHNA